MNAINRISPTYTSVQAVQKPKEGTYEANLKEVGPTAASLIGLATTAGDAAKTTYSFSSKGLSELESAAKSAYDTVGSAIHSTIDTLGTAFHGVEDGIKDAAGEIGTLGKEGLAELEGAAQTVYDKVGSAATAVENGISSAAGTVAGYATMGLSALPSLNAIA